jgi:aryl-alcohol dehydrogenase-like predicted oxidoreductase
MIHWPIHPHSIRHFTDDETIISNPPDTKQAFETLQKLKQAGKIRHVGVSNFGVNRLKCTTELVDLAVNQLPYNLLCRAIEYDVLDSCKKEGIGVIGYMALLQGILADKYPSIGDIPVWRRRTRHFDCARTRECRHGEKGCEKESSEALMQIRRISREEGLPMSELAIKWTLANPAITCTLAGARNLDQLKANAKAVEPTLSQDTIDELKRVTLPVMERLGNHIDLFESAENDRTV